MTIGKRDARIINYVIMKVQSYTHKIRTLQIKLTRFCVKVPMTRKLSF